VIATSTPGLQHWHLLEGGDAAVGPAASVVVGRLAALDQLRRLQRAEQFALDGLAGDLLGSIL
jgi:hypothetical protein